MAFYNSNRALDKLDELQISTALTNIQEKHDTLYREYKLLEKQNKDLTNFIIQNKLEAIQNTNQEIERLTRINTNLRNERDSLKQQLDALEKKPLYSTAHG